MRDMSLDLEIIHIKDVCFGDKTRIENGLLTIDKSEFIGEINSNEFVTVDVDIAKPGESVRLIPVKDVIEPRIKV